MEQLPTTEQIEEQFRQALRVVWDEAETLDQAFAGIRQACTDFENLAEAAELARQAEAERPVEPIELRTWGGYDANVYYNPEKCGLELLAMAQHEPDYDFDMCLLLKDTQSGRFFMVSDSGCSCPTPFEDVRSVSDLTEVRTRGEAQKFLTQWTPYRGATTESLTSMLIAITDNLPAY